MLSRAQRSMLAIIGTVVQTNRYQFSLALMSLICLVVSYWLPAARQPSTALTYPELSTKDALRELGTACMWLFMLTASFKQMLAHPPTGLLSHARSDPAPHAEEPAADEAQREHRRQAQLTLICVLVTMWWGLLILVGLVQVVLSVVLDQRNHDQVEFALQLSGTNLGLEFLSLIGSVLLLLFPNLRYRLDHLRDDDVNG